MRDENRGPRLKKNHIGLKVRKVTLIMSLRLCSSGVKEKERKYEK